MIYLKLTQKIKMSLVKIVRNKKKKSQSNKLSRVVLPQANRIWHKGRCLQDNLCHHFGPECNLPKVLLEQILE